MTIPENAQSSVGAQATGRVFPDPAFPSVYAAFCATAARLPDRPFLRVLPETAGIYGIAAGDISYGAALAQVRRARESYRLAGYGFGHRVGLLLENRPAFFIQFLALNSLGVSVVPIGLDLRAAELEYLIGHSELCLVISLPERIDALQAAARAARRPLTAVPPEGVDAVGPPAVASPDSPARDPDVEDECALLYTSGTTGQPKGCVLANRYFLQMGFHYVRLGGLCTVRPDTETLITPLPMTHMNAFACSTTAMMVSGGCVVPLDRFHPKSWWDSVRASRATIVHYLGVMPAMLMSAAPDPTDTDHEVRFGFGAGVDRRLHAPFEQRFGFPLTEGWAMTETGAGGIVTAHVEPRHVGTACFGKAPPEVEVRLIDDEGRLVPDGENGELLVRAYGLDPRRGFFREYLKDPVATAEAWSGGWFHTGDIVRRDAEGDFHFVDRKKNVIRRSGENISAVEVESVLRQHPEVQEVAVAATPDAVRGDEVLACVVPRRALTGAEQASVANDIVAHCLERLSYFKAPGYVGFVASLPLTSSQKIQRGELKRLAAGMPGTPGVIDTRALKRRQAS